MAVFGAISEHITGVTAIGILVATCVVNFLIKLYRARSTMLELRRRGLVRDVAGKNMYQLLIASANATLQPHTRTSRVLCKSDIVVTRGCSSKLLALLDTPHAS